MLYYQDSGLSSQESFLLKSIYSIVIIGLEIPSGYFADKMGRKNTLVIGAIMGVLGMLTYGIFSGFWAFLFAEIALGVSQSFVSGSDSAMMYDSLKQDNRQSLYTKFEGRNTAIGNGAESIAAILGGLLAEISFKLPFIVQSGIALIAVPAALTLIEPPNLRQGHETIKHTFRVVVNTIFKDKALSYYLLFSSIIGSCTLTMAWIYHPYLKEVLNISLYQIGLIAAALNLIAAIFSATAHTLDQKLSKKTILSIIGVFVPLSYIAIGFINSIYALGVFALFYMIRGVATPVLKDLVNTHTPSDIRATVLSVRNFVIRMVFVFIAPAFGYLTDNYGYQQSFIVAGLSFSLLTIFFLSKGIRK